MVKVQSHLSAELHKCRIRLKYWCRMQDLNPRPSVYKTARPVPVTSENSQFFQTDMRFRPIVSGLMSAHRCKVRLRAVVAFQMEAR